MEGELSVQAVTNDISNENDEEEENSSPQLTVLTTVAYDYTDLPEAKPYDRMDIDNHNIEFDDSNQVSSTTEPTLPEPIPEPQESVSEQPVEKVEEEEPIENKELPLPEEERKPVKKRDSKRSVSPSTTPGKSRYGRVRKQKLSTDFVSVDRKSFAVLNSNSYEPTIAESQATNSKPEKTKRAYRKKIKYAAENNGSEIVVKEEPLDDGNASKRPSAEIDSAIDLVDDSSRSSLNMNTIKTYSRKGDGTINTGEKSASTNDDENAVQVNYSKLDWKVGDIAWAKIGCYPYWPSIVTLEYGTSIYVKPVGKQQSRLAVHVHFFGDKGRRSWVLTTSLMKYESKEQFMELKRQFIKDKLRMKYFIIPPRIEDLWEKAVGEADTILRLPIVERPQYYQNLYPMMLEMYTNESTSANKAKNTPDKDKNGTEVKRGRKRKILNDSTADDSVVAKKVKLEDDSPSSTVTNETDEKKQRESKEKKQREPVDEHTKNRRAFMRRMNQILKQSNAASLPPKKRIKLQVKEEQAFNRLLESNKLAKERSQGDNSSSSLDSKKNDMSIYDFESDEETDVFIGTYNSKFTPQILDKIEQDKDADAEKPSEATSPSRLPISLDSSTSAEVPPTTMPEPTTPDVEAQAITTPKVDSGANESFPSPSTSLKKRIGRPKGSKNKIKSPEETEPAVKRKRGRPSKKDLMFQRKRGRPSKKDLLMRKKYVKLLGKKRKLLDETASPQSSSELPPPSEPLDTSKLPETDLESPKKPYAALKNFFKKSYASKKKLEKSLAESSSPGTPTEKKKMGRPRKIKPEIETSLSEELPKTSQESIETEDVKTDTNEQRAEEPTTSSVSEKPEEQKKRKLGRPLGSKNKVLGGKLLPRKRGRPRKIDISDKMLKKKRQKLLKEFMNREQSLKSITDVDSLLSEADSKKRVSEKVKKSLSKVNNLIPTFDLSSDEEDSKSEEGKHRSASPPRSKKAINIFLGVKTEKVCQICLQLGDVVRCRGSCCGFFHVECDKKSEEKENEVSCVKPVARGRRKRSTLKNATVDPCLVKPIAMNGEVSIKTEALDDTEDRSSALNSEASPRRTEPENATPVNGVLDSEAVPKEETEREQSTSEVSISGPESLDLVRINSNETNPVTSTDMMVNGTASSEDEIPTKEVTSDTVAPTTKESSEEVHADKEAISAEDEISSSTGETANSKMTNGVNGGVTSLENEETCSSETFPENTAPTSKTNNANGVDFYCHRCLKERLYPCLSCGKEVQEKTKETFRYSCYVIACGKTYHKECLKEWPQASWGTSSTVKESLRCPQHYCHTCISENPAVLKTMQGKEGLVKCVKCPTSYHKRVHCLPAGTEILNSSQIICPRHYEPPPGMRQGHLNATWCFICCVGGSLICCDECPMSFHADCLKLQPEEYEGRYICDDCQSGRYILYGEIAWVKLGHFRWWPAKVLFPYEIPENIQNLPHRSGEFVVEFFGSHDYNWVNRGRAFLYQEGDSGKKSCKRNSVDMTFEKAMAEAEDAFQKLLVDKAARDEVARLGLKPPRYGRIKANKPIGNVKIIETDTSNISSCECDPTSEKPCSADSDCLNRMLLVECHPAVCPAGERCMNQVFEKKVYPPLIPYKTEKRGWGLKTLVDMKKGDFIIEYVGEMIDEEEYKKRINIMHKKHEDNYYFLTIDNQRMLDAGPKGNVSRFMNHSCDPNCETQKWTVNGDTRIGLFALKNIPANTELVFNYNLATQGNEKRPCFCGSENCSGFIGMKAAKNGNSSTDEESRKKSNEDSRKKSGESGSNAANENRRKADKRRAKKMKKKRLLQLAAGTGKLAAAKRTTDLRMKMKMKKLAALSSVTAKEQSKPPVGSDDGVANEKLELGNDGSKKSTIVKFKKLVGRPPKKNLYLKRKMQKTSESSLLMWHTPVGEYTSPEIEALFKQRELFRKEPVEATTDANNTKKEEQPYVERRGRKKTPKDVNEKKEFFLQILKRRIAQKIANLTLHEVDSKCFKCGLEGELLFCDNNSCPRGYHLSCVKKTAWPTGRWLCPWHYCILCQSRSRIIKCSECMNSYCVEHHRGNIFEESEDRYSCKNHKSEKAVQAHFKSIAMMRLMTLKNEMDAEMVQNKIQTAANLMNIETNHADVIKGPNPPFAVSTTDKTDKKTPGKSLTAKPQIDEDLSKKKNIKESEPVRVKMIGGKRKLSNQQVVQDSSCEKIRESEQKTAILTKEEKRPSDGLPKTDKGTVTLRVIKRKRKPVIKKANQDSTKTEVTCNLPPRKKPFILNDIDRTTVSDHNPAAQPEVESIAKSEGSVTPNGTRKISRTARKSIRSSNSTYASIPAKSESDSVANNNGNDSSLVKESADPAISDDEFVDFEVEVLNDSD